MLFHMCPVPHLENWLWFSRCLEITYGLHYTQIVKLGFDSTTAQKYCVRHPTYIVDLMWILSRFDYVLKHNNPDALLLFCWWKQFEYWRIGIGGIWGQKRICPHSKTLETQPSTDFKGKLYKFSCHDIDDDQVRAGWGIENGTINTKWALLGGAEEE